MGSIVLARVDSRLIHGQVITKWLSQVGAERIIVINNALVKDPFMMSIYKMAAPPNIKIDVFSIDDAASAWTKDQFGNGKILLLFADLKSALEAIEKGVEIKKLQVGGLGGAPNRKVIFQNITLDSKDMDILKALEVHQVDVIFQVIPEDRVLQLKEVYTKYNK